MMKMPTELDTFAERCRLRVEAALNRFLPGEQTMPAQLHQAMRYSALNGGKRVRPLLVYASGQVDPDPQTFEMDLVTGPPYAMRSGLLGVFTVEISTTGGFTLTADNVVAEGIASMTITRFMRLGSFKADYTIEFEGGGGAEGTIEATLGA